jgi:hypothetical protein
MGVQFAWRANDDVGLANLGPLAVCLDEASPGRHHDDLTTEVHVGRRGATRAEGHDGDVEPIAVERSFKPVRHQSTVLSRRLRR